MLGLLHVFRVIETATAQLVPVVFSLDISPISVTFPGDAVTHSEAVTAVDGSPAGASRPITSAG